MILASSGRATPSSVKPRHVLCFLGGEPDWAPLAAAANAAIGKFATGFHVDTRYSQGEPDERMERSFGVSWDRVAPGAWTHVDEDAVTHHKSVLYVLSPPMTADTAVTISTAALFLVEAVITAGAVAVKGESAGVAHGLARWRELTMQCSRAVQAGDDFATSRACRLAFAKRPLESDKYVESVGFHLVGLPEVYVAKGLGTDRAKAAIMDAVADELTERKLDDVLRDRKARLSHTSTYAEDDFKFNPFGIVYIDQI
jgi:hypothetical protein